MYIRTYSYYGLLRNVHNMDPLRVIYEAIMIQLRICELRIDYGRITDYNYGV